jgi:hypothetical protein
VCIIDKTGKSVSGAVVRLSFENYSIEDTSHEEDLTTGVDGCVEFPKHSTWTIVGKRILYTARSASALVHASFGPHDFVFATRDGQQGDVVENGILYDWTGQPDQLNSTIVIK